MVLDASFTGTRPSSECLYEMLSFTGRGWQMTGDTLVNIVLKADGVVHRCSREIMDISSPCLQLEEAKVLVLLEH